MNVSARQVNVQTISVIVRWSEGINLIDNIKDYVDGIVTKILSHIVQSDGFSPTILFQAIIEVHNSITISPQRINLLLLLDDNIVAATNMVFDSLKVGIQLLQT